MSTQKGNINRSRSQKHQNSKAFKNNLHDNTVKTQIINSLEIKDVCERCKEILEWKIRYKKYKLLKNPKVCSKCGGKKVTLSYRMMCSECAIGQSICPKCGLKMKRNESEEGNQVDSDV